jgi:hypothetical protein
MLYSLPNGQKVDLTKVSSISKIRDYGRDSKTIDVHLVGFAIHLQKREIVEVTESYYFSDWAVAKKKLKALHADIIEKWEQEKADSE